MFGVDSGTDSETTSTAAEATGTAVAAGEYFEQKKEEMGDEEDVSYGEDTLEEEVFKQVTDCLTNCSVSISELAQGIPLGGELDFMDEGTLIAALKDRRVT